MDVRSHIGGLRNVNYYFIRVYTYENYNRIVLYITEQIILPISWCEKLENDPLNLNQNFYCCFSTSRIQVFFFFLIILLFLLFNVPRAL
jgi:hypothetical protein